MKELFGPIHAYYLVITVVRAKDGDGGNTMYGMQNQQQVN